MSKHVKRLACVVITDRGAVAKAHTVRGHVVLTDPRFAMCLAAGQVSEYGDGYPRVTRGGKKQLLHRVIAANAGMDLSAVIDHVSGDIYDCRLTNLRPATNRQNRCNTRARASMPHGKGVTYYPSMVSRRWRARVRLDGREIYGFFHTEAEAIEAAKAYREELHQDFCRHD